MTSQNKTHRISFFNIEAAMVDKNGLILDLINELKNDEGTEPRKGL